MSERAVDARAITVRRGKKTLLDNVHFSVESGSWCAIVGPNGAGKSTLVHCLVGICSFDGVVFFHGTNLRELSARQRAAVVAFAPQVSTIPAAMTVQEFVMLGRTPHIGLLGSQSARDRRAVAETMDQMDLMGFSVRAMEGLSGGERQRAVLAQALVQEAPILLLDEPTTSLDIGHQQQVLELIDAMRIQRNLTVITTLHDLTLAGQYAGEVTLLNGGHVVASGPPVEVLTAERVAVHYGASVEVSWRGDSDVSIRPVRVNSGFKRH